MALRALRSIPVLFLLLVSLGAAHAAETRRIVTTENADYFGFDLRSEQNVTLDQCEATCLGDPSCRAFTYNRKAKWCFLKSDFNTLNPFNGAVAGKVTPVSGDPDIGAPPELAFFPPWMADQALQYRNFLLGPGFARPVEGVNALVDAAEQASLTGDHRIAMEKYEQAVSVLPDEIALWIGLSRATLAAQMSAKSELSKLKTKGTSTAFNAYTLSRTTAERAEALALLAAGLDRREAYRSAIQAYEASLALVNSASVRAEYEDLKARKGFRIVDHTVEADTSAPRICVRLSEELVKTGVDYAQFVTVDGRAPKAVEAKGRQICVEGLEHGRHYDVAFRAGLPAAIGEVISSPVALSIYVQDRAPSARFTGDSFVLPAGTRRGIPLVSINMDVAELKLYRIGDRSLAQLLSGYQFLRQLDGYDISSISDQMGEPVWEGRMEIASELNKEVTTSFPVDEALPERKPGVYILTAQPVDDRSESYQSRATQWFVVSDIGLSTYTGQDGLNVFVRSLSTAKPIQGAELTLLARNNEILGSALTDAEGRASFNPGLTRGEGGMVPAVLMARQGDEDFVFLDMTKAGFDLSDRGVEGRPAPGALDVYTWTERGIYRAGEVVHVAALARDGAANAVENLPLTFIFTRPDGVEARRVVSEGVDAGGHAVDLPLEPNAMRGTWTVAVHTDPREAAIASQMFLVEDFVPDRIEFDLTADKTEIAPGEAANVTVDGRFLYGAPAAGLDLEGETTLTTTREWGRIRGFVFGLADEQSSEARVTPLTGLPAADEDGRATFPVSFDQLPSTTKLVKAKVTVRMRETGGRAVERSLEIGIRPQGSMIGIRPDFAGHEVPQGGTARFSIIAVDPNGERETLKGALWSLVRVERHYQWYRSGGYWNYEPVEFTQSVAQGTIDISATGEAELEVPVDWGRYRLQIETTDPEGPASSYEFYGGWYVEASSTETPDALEIALDKDSYRPGEVAKLKVSPHYAGQLLVTVGADRLLKTFSTEVPSAGATVDVPVGEDWGAGAYVTATLFRPGQAQESRMPARAIGVKWLKVDPGAKKLEVTLTPPEKLEPRQTLSIPVSVSGASDGDKAYIMVAAVDVGILNLTDYKAPDPEAWFYGQRMMGLELRDLYGRLIDGSLGTMGRLRTGGDGAAMQSQGSPPTEKLVAYFSGPVQLDGAGKAIVDFDLPQFNGTVRVMAVAWTKRAVGHAVTDVIVRDPVVLTASLPRFLAPGDSALMRVDVVNTDGPDGEYSVSVQSTGGLSLGNDGVPAKLTLASGKRQTFSVPLTAVAAGQSTITVSLSHRDGPDVEQTLFLPVRPSQLPITTRLVVDLKGNGGALRVDRELLAASQLDGASVSIGISRAAAFDVASLLMTLDRYPYGCTEQTTSRALPLLYVDELSKGFGIAVDADIRDRVQQAIYRVLGHQASSGSFGMWGAGSGDLWLDSYVTDFLTRAREQKYDVPALAFEQALSNLQNALAYEQNVQDRGSEIAYALYVLARNKKASIGDLRYYADTQIEAFSSPMAVAQLGAALALYGDAQRSKQAFEVALRLAMPMTDHDWRRRADYGSKLRDGAAMLALAAESKPVPPVVPDLVSLVATERAAKRWTSTQDEAWMLLAARALKEGNESIQITVNGEPRSGAWSAEIGGDELLAAPLTLANTGQQSVQAVVTAVAAPAQPLPAGGDGYSIERAYYRLDGTEANVTEVKQNERFVVVLKVRKHNDWPQRVLVTDLLPGGFEIDNPSLVSSAQLSSFPWLAQTSAAHLEFRDDRFVAAFNPDTDRREMTLAYVVRAVTPGVYVHPPASVEDMYRPHYSARTATGMMEVKAP